MIRFFRTIRKKLIEQDNVRKYLLYAIGEILLVEPGYGHKPYSVPNGTRFLLGTLFFLPIFYPYGTGTIREIPLSL
jgi:hypothetical protein